MKRYLWFSQKALDAGCSTSFWKIDGHGEEVEVTLATEWDSTPDGYPVDAKCLGVGVWSRRGRPNTGDPERGL